MATVEDIELRPEKLDFWIEAGFNALFIGRHGVGKSSRIFDAFDRAKLRWQYFSTPTLDPWVDFVGVPQEAKDENGSYIDLILPKRLRDDQIDAIFLDELNRSHPKIQNAVLELVQFRSINGRKFKNLKIVWASINPLEAEYKVQDLDPALKDRFPVWCVVPYKPDLAWFVKHYGDRLGNAIVSWWGELPPNEKLIVTPRRLQYVLDMYKKDGGDIRDVLPPGCNVSKLLSAFSTGPINQKLKEIYDSNNQDAARRFLMVENHYASAVRYLQTPSEFNIQPLDWFSFWLPVMPNEKLATLMATSDTICCFVADHPDLGKFTEIMENIVTANQNKVLVRKIKKRLETYEVDSLAGKYGRLRNLNAETPYHSNKDVNWDEKIAAFSKMPLDKTPERKAVYVDLVSHLPEVMTLDQSLGTIELLGVIADRTWPQKLKDYRYFMGVVNHCIKQIWRCSGLSWAEILKKFPSKFERLLPKVMEAGFEKKLLCPVSSNTAFSANINDPAAQEFLNGNDSSACPF